MQSGDPPQDPDLDEVHIDRAEHIRLKRRRHCRASEPGERRQDLRAVTKKCRPDWDITTPELRAAWKDGRKDLFYPYGKRFAQTLGEQD